MSKKWPDQSWKRSLNAKLLRDFRKEQEQKLDGDHEHWSPKSEGTPTIGNEEAWPLLGEENEH